MKIKKEAMRLYAVTDRTWLAGRTLAQVVEEALKGGVTMVQLREKHLDDETFLQEAIELKAICKSYGVPFVINDRVDIALKSGADGVHLGQSDEDIRKARAELGEDKIIGATAHNVEEAVTAAAAGADYLGCGAAFGSTTKTDAKPIELALYQKITSAVDIPVVAIGGINIDNAERLTGSGVDGIAVVSGIFAAEDIEAASRALFEASGRISGCN